MSVDPMQFVGPILGAVSDVGYDTLRFNFPGLVLNLLFEGILIAMYVSYIVRPNHPKWESYSVSASLVATSFVTGCYIYRGWHQMVRGYGRPNNILSRAAILDGEAIIGTTIAAFASCVYASRLFALTGNQIWIKIVFFFSLFIKWCLTWGVVVITVIAPKITADFFDPTLAEQGQKAQDFFYKWLPYYIVDSSFFVVLELILCVATIIMIQRERARATYKRTQHLLTHILLVSSRSLVIPVIFYFTNILLLSVGPNPGKCEVIASCLPKTALFSLLMLYQDRDDMRLVRSVHNTLDGVEIRMDTVQQTSPGMTSMGGGVHTFRGLQEKYNTDPKGRDMEIELENESNDGKFSNDPYSSKEKLSQPRA